MEHVEKQKQIVKIGGKSYSLVTSQSPAQIQRILHLINTKLNDFSSVSSINTSELPLMMSALSLADELIIAEDDNTRLRRELHEGYEKIKK